VCVCVAGWGCDYHETSVREGMYVCNIIYSLLGRKDRCIKTHDTSTITTATRASAMSAGAHKYDDNAFFELIALAYPPLTHTQAHTQQVLGKGVVEPASMLLMAWPLPSIRSAYRRMRAYVSVRAYVSARDRTIKGVVGLMSETQDLVYFHVHQQHTHSCVSCLIHVCHDSFMCVVTHSRVP